MPAQLGQGYSYHLDVDTQIADAGVVGMVRQVANRISGVGWAGEAGSVP